MSLRRRLDRLERHIDPDYCPVCAARPAVEIHDEDDGPVPPVKPCPVCGRPPANLLRIILSTTPDRREPPTER